MPRLALVCQHGIRGGTRHSLPCNASCGEAARWHGLTKQVYEAKTKPGFCRRSRPDFEAKPGWLFEAKQGPTMRPHFSQSRLLHLSSLTLNFTSAGFTSRQVSPASPQAGFGRALRRAVMTGLFVGGPRGGHRGGRGFMLRLKTFPAENRTKTVGNRRESFGRFEAGSDAFIAGRQAPSAPNRFINSVRPEILSAGSASSDLI